MAVGDTAVLHCRTSIPDELVKVWWIRIKDGKHSIISIFQDGRDQQRCDLPEYVGRTELVKEGLARGSASLKLFNISIIDEGAYRCILETKKINYLSDVNLNTIALGSPPKITFEELQEGGIKAVCRSAGWYPEPKLANKDDDGELEIRQEENGFYSIKYSCVIKENSITFSCRIYTLYPSQEREASLNIADGLIQKHTDGIISIVLWTIASCLVAVAAPVANYYLWARQIDQATYYTL